MLNRLSKHDRNMYKSQTCTALILKTRGYFDSSNVSNYFTSGEIPVIIR